MDENTEEISSSFLDWEIPEIENSLLKICRKLPVFLSESLCPPAGLVQDKISKELHNSSKFIVHVIKLFFFNFMNRYLNMDLSINWVIWNPKIYMKEEQISYR